MSFRSRRGSARRDPTLTSISIDDDEPAVVVRKPSRLPRQQKSKRPVDVIVDTRPARPIHTGLYSNGGLELLRKEQRRITNTCPGLEQGESIPGTATSTIPSAESIAAARLKRQDLRAKGHPAQYIPLDDQSVSVAGGLYGQGSGRSGLIRDEDDDDVPDLTTSAPKLNLSTITEEPEEDDAMTMAVELPGTIMSESEAEIQIRIASRLDQCRRSDAQLTEESTLVQDRLAALELQMNGFSKEIVDAEAKYIGLQEMHSRIATLLDCVSSKIDEVDRLWGQYRDVRDDRSRHMNLICAAHWADQDRPMLIPDQDAGAVARRERSRQRRTMSSAEEGWTTYGDTDVERESFQMTLEIRNEAQGIFRDVMEEFSSCKSVLSIFSMWRDLYPKEYGDAFCDLSLPRLLSPYLKLFLINSDITTDQGMASLVAIRSAIRSFSPTVDDSLMTALIAPFLTKTLSSEFLPFSMRDMTRCRSFCNHVRVHFENVEIGTTLRMLFIDAGDRLPKTNTDRDWGRSLKLLFALKTMSPIMGPDFMLRALSKELTEKADTERREQQLSSIINAP